MGYVPFKTEIQNLSKRRNYYIIVVVVNYTELKLNKKERSV